MEHRSRRTAARASTLAACVLALVALGYALCFGMLAVCPALIPSPEWWPVAAASDVFQRSMANLLYWMVACTVAIACAVLITLLAGRALRALGELEPRHAPGSSPASFSSLSGEKR